MTEEEISRIFDSGVDIMQITRNRLEPEQLEDDQGHRLWHIKVYAPLMMENRSIIVCEYKGKTSDGLNVMAMSSQGNES